MDVVVQAVTDMAGQVGDVSTGMKVIFGSLVALALLGLLFSRIGK